MNSISCHSVSYYPTQPLSLVRQPQTVQEFNRGIAKRTHGGWIVQILNLLLLSIS